MIMLLSPPPLSPLYSLSERSTLEVTRVVFFSMQRVGKHIVVYEQGFNVSAPTCSADFS